MHCEELPPAAFSSAISLEDQKESVAKGSAATALRLSLCLAVTESSVTILRLSLGLAAIESAVTTVGLSIGMAETESAVPKLGLSLSLVLALVESSRFSRELPPALVLDGFSPEDIAASSL